jgi:protein ImuB
MWRHAVDRLACVDLAAFPLQLLLLAEPTWARLPAAVVEDDKPQALVLFVNMRARRLGVRPGQRYATALSLASNLQAGVISPSQIERHVRLLADRLRRYSPHVEPASDAPGVFWLDAQGLGRLYPSLHAWAQAVRLDLQRAGMRATVAVGFTRFGAYALAKFHQGTTVCEDAGEEQAAVQRVPLVCVELNPTVRERLLTLGIQTIGEFLRLPADGIKQRFGEETDTLYQLAAGHRWAPLVPVPADQPHERLAHFDTPEARADRLIFIVKRQLDSLLAELVRLGHAVIELVLWMKLDDRTARTESVRPAASTLDATQLLALVRLRLDALRLPAGIVTLRLTAITCPATSEQRRLFPHYARRDPELADQAFARLRAEFGEQSVVSARLGNGHLPTAQFTWEPIAHIPLRASPAIVTARPLVRRILAQPRKLGADFVRPALGSGLLALGTSSEACAKAQSLKPEAQSLEPRAVAAGPYVIAGAWWNGGVRRDYYFTPAENGNLWWVFFDHRRRRFFLQGFIE